MATDRARTLAAALAAQLAAIDWGARTVTVAREHLPTKTVEELADLHVSVVAPEEEGAAETRGTEENHYTVDLIFQKRLEAATTDQLQDDAQTETDDEVDELLDVIAAVKIAIPLGHRPSVTGWQPILVARKHEPRVDPRLLFQSRCFLSVLTLTYRAST